MSSATQENLRILWNPKVHHRIHKSPPPVKNPSSMSRDHVVTIATRYGLEGPAIESRRGRDFTHLSRPAPRPTQPPVQWVPGLSRGKGGRGVVLTTDLYLVPRFTKKSRAIPLPSLRIPRGLNMVKPRFT
jgi:hypothetical protein